ncbi:MAG: UMP kinase [Patescibacteria group bacterium]
MNEEIIIVSLGGSLIIPEEIDKEFLKDFKKIILSQIKKGKKFVIITGGGKICRKYQCVAKEIKGEMSSSELDWLGIYSTRFNAEFMKILFSDLAEEEIILDPTLPITLDKPMVFGGGWKPGWSTDYVSVMLAKQLKIKKIINLSNTDFVYDSDPKINPNAKKIEKISWKDYRDLIPAEWNPGLNTPFDPIASKIAEEEEIEVVIMNGKLNENFAKYLNKEEFKGTVIS